MDVKCRLANKGWRNRGLISSWDTTSLLAVKFFKIKRFLYPVFKRQSFSAKEADNLICALFSILGRGAGRSRVPPWLPHTWPHQVTAHRGGRSQACRGHWSAARHVSRAGDEELRSLLRWLQKQPEDVVWALGQTITAAWTTQGVILSEGVSSACYSSDLSFPEQKHWFVMLLNNLFQKKEEDYAMKPVSFAQSEARGGLLVPPRGDLVEGLGCLRAQRGPVVWGCCGTPPSPCPFFQQRVLDTADAGSHMQAAGVLQRRGERVRKLQTWWYGKQAPAASGAKLNLASWKQR